MNITKKMTALVVALGLSGMAAAQIPVTPPGGGGSGSVTSVAVTTANGVSGTVANPTTTPAISLTLGATTPTSVAATTFLSAGSTITAAGVLSAANYAAGEVARTDCTASFPVAPQLVTVTLSAACTFTIANGSALQVGREICFQFTQAATGGPFAVTPPANVHGFFTIGTTASRHSMQCFVWSGVTAGWMATSPGIADVL